MTSAALAKSLGTAVRRASIDATLPSSLVVSLRRKSLNESGSLFSPHTNSNVGLRRNSTQLCESNRPYSFELRRHSSPLVDPQGPITLDKIRFLSHKEVVQNKRGSSALKVVEEGSGDTESLITDVAPNGTTSMPDKLRQSRQIRKDAFETFQQVWEEMKEKYGEYIPLPREVIWLTGAPGAGKGINTLHIQNARNIKSSPIVVSGLLDSPTCKAIKAVGGMIDDKVVLKVLLEEMRRPEYRDGVVVDGFPRTAMQVEFIRLIHENCTQTNGEEPDFRIAVLHVPKEESITRQLLRGVELKLENAKRALKGLPLLESRPTDHDPAHAAARYQAYSTHYEQVLSMKDSYSFHWIDASGSKERVKKIIEEVIPKAKDRVHNPLQEDEANFLGAIREAMMVTMGNDLRLASNP